MTPPINNREPLPHLRVDRFRTASRFKPVTNGPDSKESVRDRQDHGTRLAREYDASVEFALAQLTEKDIQEWDGQPGIYLELESAPGSPLPGIDWRNGVRLGATKVSDIDSETGALFVPIEREEEIRKRITSYLNEDTKTPGTPKHQPLVEAIERISPATVSTLWTDPRPIPSDPTESRWWECWTWSDYTDELVSAASRQHLRVGDRSRWLRFPDFHVVPVFGTTVEISQLTRRTGAIAELRSATESPTFYTSHARNEQRLWVGDLLNRLVPADENSPVVCLLDSGVAWSHPLLNESLTEDDCQTVDPSWLSDDSSKKGHGTQMAGIVLYSDLTYPLADRGKVEPGIRLESVKILPRHGMPGNEPTTFGSITQSGVAIAEINKPQRSRVFCMAITYEDVSGEIPGSWSAALDQICSGSMAGDQDNADPKETAENPRRLFMVSCGNIRDNQALDGWANPDDFPVEEPAQSWNALTIGGYTDKVDIDHPNLTGWSAVANVGDRSPFSRVSCSWDHHTTPIKPELVFEAGNRAISPGRTEVTAGVESLSLLTTSREFISRNAVLVEETFGTSAATAQAAGMASRILAEHPDLWPETIRALMVHSASWSPEMLRQLNGVSSKRDKARILRRFGYGIPSLPRALASTNNDVVLLAEAHLQPFRQGEDREARLNEAHYYKLPWPKRTLEVLPGNVQLKVTLSYFVEPNPGQLPGAGAAPRRYRSHGLQFDLKRSQESSTDFYFRSNAIDKRPPTYKSVKDDEFWMFGPGKSFGAGSLHCDVWTGPAANLAARDELVIFPTTGWWYSKKRSRRMDAECRYSLIVSLTSQELDVDLYTEIAQAIEIETETEVSV